MSTKRSAPRRGWFASRWLIPGIGGVLIGTGTGPNDFGLKGIALCAVVAIALNLILPGNDSWKHKKADESLL